MFILMMVATLISCSKTDDMDVQYKSDVEVAIDFSIFNAQHEDLLNPKTPNHINTDDIRLYYVINGESKEYFKENLDPQRGYFTWKYKGIYRIRIFLNCAESESKPVTYVRWNDKDTDTIKVFYRRAPGLIAQDTIWLNGEQIWKFGDGSIDPYFKLKK